jgi:hypothetical protein
MITGSCHCGLVSFEFSNPVQKLADCKCRDCQKSTGSLISQIASISPQQMTFTGKQPERFTPSTGEQCDLHGGWLFCGNCGSRLAWFSNAGNLYDVLRGTIDNPDDIRVGP